MQPIFGPFEAGTTEKPFCVAQLGQSLDGRIATVTGDSKYINGAAALDHLHAIRANVDAVVVGIGTVLADDPMLTVRRVPGRSPARVVIDPTCRLPPDAKLLADDGARRVVICREGAWQPPPGVEAVRMPDPGAFCPREIRRILGALGFRRILIEGGSRTISDFVDAGALDRLHVLVAPLLIGSGKSALDLAPIHRLSDALRPAATAHLLADGDVLFDCDLTRS